MRFTVPVPRRSNLFAVLTGLAGAALLVVALAGCGSGASDAGRAAVYAQQVKAITVSTRSELNKIAQHVDYTSADSAAASVTEYASTIRAAASDLSRIPAPPAVAPAHRKLVALYRQTANRMDVIAGRFKQSKGARQIARDAQQLNGEVAAYSKSEGELRAEIERAITEATSQTST